MCELEWCEEIKIVIFMARVNRSHLRPAQAVTIHASLISDSSIFDLAVIVTLSFQGPSFRSSRGPDVARTITNNNNNNKHNHMNYWGDAQDT